MSTREEIVARVAAAVDKVGAEFVGRKFSERMKTNLEDAIFQVVAREASLEGMRPPRIVVRASMREVEVCARCHTFRYPKDSRNPNDRCSCGETKTYPAQREDGTTMIVDLYDPETGELWR